MRTDLKILLTGLLFFILIYLICLILEWSGLTGDFDPIEDVVGAVVPMWWAFLFYGFLSEISERERRRSEEALMRSESQYRLLLESTAEAIYGLDLEGRCILANPACLRLLGYSSDDQIVGKNVHELIHHTRPNGSEYPWEECSIFQTFRQGEHYHDDGEVMWRADGTSFPAEYSSHPIYKDGQVVGAVVTLQDISARKRAEEELKREKEKFRVLVEESPLGIMVMTKSQYFTYINPKTVEMFGYNLEDIPTVGHWLEKAYPDPDYRNQVATTWTEDCEEGKTDELPARIFKVACKDGSVKTVKFKLLVLQSGDQYIITEDITETKVLEERLRQSQKMEAIGTLASGIAHDFNNILGAILGYAELTVIHARLEENVRQNLEQIITAGKRAKDLVKQILTFSRQTEQRLLPVNVTPIVKETLKFLRSSLPKTIEIKQEIKVARDEVLADPTQIHQVIMNLGSNAAQAMKSEGGVLGVKIENVHLDSQGPPQGVERNSGRYLKVSISDTGVGMDQLTMDRIFEPYFTTKEMGEGTGMGLAVVHGIVKNCGGDIEVFSEAGQGTSFHVYLPLIGEEVPVISAPTPALPKGTEHVLFIDDEEALVDIGRQMLGRLEYKVEGISDSLAALEEIKKHPHKYDLVITDQTMPNLTGSELAKEILSINPEIPIIMCTGFSETVTAESSREIGIKAFLMKPLVLRDLAETIRTVLEE